MANHIADSLTIATDLIAVRYHCADASALLARCDAWLAVVPVQEQAIRDSRFNVSRKLDMLDKATDRVRAVRLNCVEAISNRVAA